MYKMVINTSIAMMTMSNTGTGLLAGFPLHTLISGTGLSWEWGIQLINEIVQDLEHYRIIIFSKMLKNKASFDTSPVLSY